MRLLQLCATILADDYAPKSETTWTNWRCNDSSSESLAKGSSHVRYLLSSHSVEESWQVKLFENGIDTLAKFAAFVRSEDDLTQVLKTDFGLHPAATIRNRGQTAIYLVAWNSARARIRMQAEAEASSGLREWAKLSQSPDRLRGYEAGLCKAVRSARG